MVDPFPQTARNPSFAKLRRDLGDDTAFLKFLPYKRATFEMKNEIPEAAPERLLYGDMLESKVQLWTYFTLNSYNKQKGKSDRMLTFQTIEGAVNYEASVRPGSVQKVALASWPFKHAQGYQEVEAIAKYFFIHKGIDKRLQFPVSSAPFRESLLRACQQYKAIFDRLQAKKSEGQRSSIMPTGGYHGMGQAQSHSSRGSSYTTSVVPSQAQSPAPSLVPSQAQSRAPSRAMSHASSRDNSMVSVNGRKRRHSASPYYPEESSQHQQSHTQPGRRNTTPKEVSDISSYPRLPSPFLVATRSPLRELSDDQDMEDPPVGEKSGAELESSANAEHPSSFNREAMMDQYIALKAREEELDAKINNMETECTTITDQIAELQADMNVIGNRIGNLEEEKLPVRAEKKKLQTQLDEDDYLDFGFEAGRRMETKWQRTS